MTQNRLSTQSSPYLLQHANNPVDWYPWGEEAFRKARTEDKPVFLSIGYATCHWCHVMEKESFENPEIAGLLNQYFISVKVDREERPDVDHLYMQAVVAMTSAGGWPLSVFLTPDLKPFYGGTYFPPDDRMGRPGFKTTLGGIAAKWKSERGRIIQAGGELANLIQLHTEKKNHSEKTLPAGIFDDTVNECESHFDEEFGGFGGAPKFPGAHQLSFLLHEWKRTSNPSALRMVKKTLAEMSRGGMFDQLGGGFHRYSTDEKWFLPHFEKMLYDQALLSKVYTEAYLATGKDEYARTAHAVLRYVLRDMTSPDGAFYSAEDADSDSDSGKKEGAFYVWTSGEIDSLLDRESAVVLKYYWGIEENGNVVEDPFGEFVGQNILHCAALPGEPAHKFGKSSEEIGEMVKNAALILEKARCLRPRPFLDDKILTDWNALMISSLACAAVAFGDPVYRDAVVRATKFVLDHMIAEEGRLMHSWRNGKSAVKGFLDDYSFMVNALLDVYSATFDVFYLQKARTLAEEMIRLFWDPQDSGFFIAGKDARELISDLKPLYDSAVPSGNSMAVYSLVRLGRALMENRFLEYAEKTVAAFAGEILRSPTAFTQMLSAYDLLLRGTREIVVAGNRKDSAMQAIFATLFGSYLPDAFILFHPSDAGEAGPIRGMVPFLEKQIAQDGKPTVYVCRGYECRKPITEISGLKSLL